MDGYLYFDAYPDIAEAVDGMVAAAWFGISEFFVECRELGNYVVVWFKEQRVT